MRRITLILLGIITLNLLAACGTGTEINQWWDNQRYDKDISS